ncbi:MAG: hypothetical protein IPN71_11280 [Fibrobacteres bacterium]|nr:hypothetical protein [Fibrobacterota bacterium]
MRILNRLSGCACVCLLALAGCEKEECKDKICTNEPDRPSDLLSATFQVSSPFSWDSVVVEIHSGSHVETGGLIHKWTLKGGQTPSGIALGEGTYSAKATYMKTGDTLDVYDADDASWDSNKDDCGCITGWSRNSASLDLQAK